MLNILNAASIADIEYELTKLEDYLGRARLTKEAYVQTIGLKNFYKFVLSDDFKKSKDCKRKWEKLKVRYPKWKEYPEPYLDKGLKVFKTICPSETSDK